jgi:hypothetical protein
MADKRRVRVSRACIFRVDGRVAYNFHALFIFLVHDAADEQYFRMKFIRR